MVPLRDIIPPPDAPPRYSSRPFPPYRYVPGLHPHPASHPDGHSHNPSGAHPEPSPLLPPERWCESEDYLYGADLYNNGFWWEAHEAWEGLWQQTDKQGPQGHFLQGLIQTSAAHLKRHVGQTEGKDRLLARARKHLKAVLADLPSGQAFMGACIPSYLEHVRGYFAGTISRFPFLELADSLP